jgi:hypothetical protein
MKTFIGILILGLALFMAQGSTASHTSLQVSPSPTHVGDTFSVSGCGYRPGYDISVYLYRSGDPTELVGYATHDDASGCFSVSTGYVFTSTGTYETYAYENKGSTGPGSYNQNHPAADLDFEVA